MAKAIKRKQYSKEYKTEVSNMVLVDGLTVQEVAKNEGLRNPEMVRRWVKEAQARPAEVAPAADAVPAETSVTYPPSVPAKGTSIDLSNALRDRIEALDLEIEQIEISRDAYLAALEVSEGQ